MDDFGFFGMEIDQVLDWHGGPSLLTGHDLSGTHYLAVLVAATATARSWMLAPISQTALGCVLAGRAELRDALRHTATGFVETFRIDRCGRVTTAVRLCGELEESDLPQAGERLAMVA
jgi:hypothetical protein